MIVSIVGPESCGKTTLARELAEHLSMPLVEEVARKALAGRPGYGFEDVVCIARAQWREEREASVPAVLDTDLLVVRIWLSDKFGVVLAWLEEAVRGTHRSKRYLLCAPDVPWEPDPLRENPHDRQRIFDLYREALEDLGLPFAVVRGLGAARFASALRAVHRWQETLPSSRAEVTRSSNRVKGPLRDPRGEG